MVSPKKISEDVGTARFRRRIASTEGGIYVEYLVLVGCVALVTLPAFIHVGQAIVSVYASVRDSLATPFP